jgi:hypothetical protein
MHLEDVLAMHAPDVIRLKGRLQAPPEPTLGQERADIGGTCARSAATPAPTGAAMSEAAAAQPTIYFMDAFG